MKWMAISGLFVLSALLTSADAATTSTRDDPRARQAFQAAYPVLMHPRCLNCHPKGSAPLQGDDSHPHTQNVKRGLSGHGKYGMKCGACHQSTNLPGANTPPGAAGWHLPSAQTPLVFEGRSAGELCRQFKDPHMNGGRTIQGVLDHLETPLVQWGWSPGDGRSTPPLSHDEFVRAMKTWAAKGAACP